MPSKYGPFTPVFDAAVKAVGGLYPAAVFGLVYRHCQMRRGVCDASAESLAALLGCTTKTIYRQLAQLTQDGFLEDRTPGLRNAPHTYSMTPKGLALVGETLSPSNTGKGETLSPEGGTLIPEGGTFSPGDVDFKSHDNTSKREKETTTTDNAANEDDASGKPFDAVAVFSSFPELEGLGLTFSAELIAELYSFPAWQIKRAAAYVRDRKGVNNRAGLFLSLLRKGADIPREALTPIGYREVGDLMAPIYPGDEDAPCYMDTDAFFKGGDDSGQDDLPEDVLQF